MLSSGGNINLDAGTYVVSGKLTVSSITCKGKVKLILCDNALLTVNHGIRVNKENTNEIHNTITLTQIKPDNMFISEYDLVQKIKQGTQNLVPKKVVFKKKFKK